MLQFWNTRTRALEPFTPIQAGHVGLYTCGPTVYNPLTLGNWRAFLFDDTLKRALRFSGFDVKHAMNITDVGHLVGDGDEGEDKVETAAIREGKTAWDIAKRYEGEFRAGMNALHISTDKEDKKMVIPRATDHIQEQIQLIQILEEKGFTYRISDGIYFDTAKFATYGSLSGQKQEEKEAGARVEQNAEKRHQSDFALWKFSPADQKRHMEWPSPWGVGFPGWHIECSAMAHKYLGQPFDIHCGGIDHIPVHHENEIAQSEAAFDKPLANYWLHNEFLLIDGGRMGKSLGNAYTLEDLATRGFDAVEYRYFCLGAHYRSKLNFTWEGLEGARNALQKLRRRFLEWEDAPSAPEENVLAEFKEALEDDLGTPKALALLWDFVLRSEVTPSIKRATLLKMDEVLGLGMQNWSSEIESVPANILEIKAARDQARLAKDWKASDELRAQLESQGWLVEDKAGESVLRKA